ncbi:hypothetical protein J31TS4_24660 [Paenibacillus sp. J31TS4]|uniref:RluA family pseudouridine synthase n=1 Tax=Paenibacillus sp. J31TS4 TaxID=2807195 RepID=UPI001B2B4446|nr:RluA family pseudouridine synthase [Paenibacillus sp. J31TS4]GIP39186.1 hypothetical protein J31TS4_24660 [Paenibacillus sp. J31TS4]
MRKGEWWELPLAGLPETRPNNSRGAATQEEEPGLMSPRQDADSTAAGSAVPEAAERVGLLAGRLGLPEGWVRKLAAGGGIVTAGGKVRLRLFPEEAPSDRFVPEWRELDVLYEDDFCLVVNKPAGLAVHPTEPGGGGTLANAVAAYYESTGQACRVRHIHRLDEDTTGPVLYAKNDWAQAALDEAMREKRVDRRYAALVQGVVRAGRGTIDAQIGRDRHHAKRRRVSPGGQRAVTRFETAERWADASLLRLRLETGRTHQIRVHLQHLGHPILGDRLYGGRTVPGLTRQALHGESLRFPHPFTGEPVTVEAPWPADMTALHERLRHR